MLRYLFITIISLCSLVSNGQLVVNSVENQQVTPESIIADVFLGKGVQITNISFEGLDQAVGTFENAQQYIGINKGIVLSTGQVDVIGRDSNEDGDRNFGQNDVTDTDLEALANININDVVKYEISFIPTSDTLRFRYVFASEEYPEFVCFKTNDAFGFFIQGPNPNGGFYNNTNIALVPDPTDPKTFLNIPVSINTVNGGESIASDTSQCIFDYKEYYNQTAANTPPVFNGYLDVFIAEANVVPCEEYTIKIVLGDGKDGQFDSAVFLEEKSFTSNTITITNNNPGINGGISEGCQQGSIQLALDGIRSSTFPISLRALTDPSLDNLAFPGIDYENIPNVINIPIGASSVDLELFAMPDRIIEDTEYIYIEITTDVCNVDTIVVPITENSLSNLVLDDTINVCYNIRDTISADLGILPNTGILSFENNQILPIQDRNEIRSSIIVNGIQQNNLSTDLIANICIDTLVHTRLNDLSIFLEAPNGKLLELSTSNGNRLDNDLQQDSFVNTCFTINASQNINLGNSVQGDMNLSNPTYSGEYLPEGDFESWLLPNAPSANGSYTLVISDTINEFSGQLKKWSITFNSEYDITYNWFPTNGLTNCDCNTVSFKLQNSQYYVLSVTDSYGCSNIDSIWVDVDPLPQTPNVIECEALSTSEVVFSWDQTPDFYEYQIRINENAQWISTNTNTTELLNGYKVTSTINSEFAIEGLYPEEEISIVFRALNENGCPSFNDTIYCQSLPCLGSVPVIEDIIIDQPMCDEMDRIPVQIIASDIDMPLTYRINLNGAFTIENNTGIFNEIPQGTWPIRIIDSAGCATLDSIRVDDPLPITLIADLQQITCHDDNNARIEINAFGVFPPFEYKWSDTSEANIRENLSEGVYEVTVTDQQGCTKSAIFNISNPDPITYNYQQLDTINCLGTNFGIATLDIQGGWRPYSIIWSDGSTDPVISNQEIGTEYFTIIDANNCIVSDSSEIIQNISFDITSIANEIFCFTDSVGSATVTATNGLSPYSYQWDNGETTNEPTMLYAGINTVTVTDFDGCAVTHTVEIMSPPKIEINFTPRLPSCVGASDGSLTINIEGGIGAPYAIEWFDGNLSTTANNLSMGNYCVTVMDDTLCEEVACFSLPDPQKINLDTDVINVECMGDCNGSISVNTIGGSGAFNFAWTGPNNFSSLMQNINNLCSGTYSVTVSESSSPNCFEVFEYEVGVNSQLEAFIQTTRFISCFGGEDGILQAVPQGGVPEYTFEWSPNVISQNQNAALNLTAGIYTLTITDKNGCTNTAEEILTQPDSLALTFITDDVICYGEESGNSTVEINGGVSPYLIEWETGNTDESINNVRAGNYGITVTDKLGCRTVDRTLINEPNDSIRILPQIETVTCFGGNDGRIAIFTENTIEPVSYSLNGVNYKFDRNFVGLTAGFYTVSIIDDHGCEKSEEFYIDESPPLDLDLGDDLVVFFGEEANLNVIVTNNTGNLSYVWESPNSNISFSCQNCPNPVVGNIVSSFTASVVVTDENGCTGRNVINVFVDQKDQIDVPTIFTPNNDNINDRLNIFGSPDIRVLSFKVYTRWGNLVYEGTNFIPNDPFNGWDGTINGSRAIPGTYTWTAEYLLENDDREFKAGQTILKD